ncbi:hypothetical protein L5515_018810 [Caenorhabditis briggsae]|uniref:Uncharacterized protein n=1 Tax=Caenorhabditis briggsae TaxID=6238 RepID=A0AAE9FMZ9_CAEBR|nr:hypothetical protein L5515_018810 [Caenorhabditis briggsae]
MSAEKARIAENAKCAENATVDNQTPRKHQYPRTRHKATVPTPFKKSQKKEHVEARKVAAAMNASKKKGCRDLYQEMYDAKNQSAISSESTSSW